MTSCLPLPLLQASVLQNLRLAMRRQIRRHSMRRSNSSSSRRHLGHLWTRLFPSGGRTRGHAPLLDPTGPTQITLGLQSYRTVGVPRQQASPGSGAGFGDELDMVGMSGSCCLASMDLQPYTPESPASPVSFQTEDSPEEEDLSPVSRESSRAPQSEPPTPVQSDSSGHSGPPSTPQETSVPSCNPRTSRKLVLELAVNLKGVSLRRYSSMGPLSPITPPSQTSTSHTPSQGLEVTLPPEPSTSFVKAEDNDSELTVEVPSREMRSKEERRREGKSRLCRFSRTFSDEGGDPVRETTPC